MSRGPDSMPPTPPALVAVLLAAVMLFAGPPARASSIVVQSANANSGAFAARLTLSRSCAAGDALVPDGSISSDPAQEPCGTLSANDVDVVSGSVRFKAGQSLVLGHGFSVAAAAAFVAEVGPGVLGVATLRDQLPNAETAYSVRFYVDPGNLDLTLDGQQFEHFVAYDTQGNREFLLGVGYNSSLGERRLWSAAYENDGAMRTGQGACQQKLPSGWLSIEARWKASTGSDGDLEVSVDGGQFQSLATCLALGGGLANSGGDVGSVEWGVQNMTGGDLGVMDLDDFDSRRGGALGGI